MEFELKDRERLDDLEISGLHIIQSPDKFCFTVAFMGKDRGRAFHRS